jgi:hypothetical protein
MEIHNVCTSRCWGNGILELLPICILLTLDFL